MIEAMLKLPEEQQGKYRKAIDDSLYKVIGQSNPTPDSSYWSLAQKQAYSDAHPVPTVSGPTVHFRRDPTAPSTNALRIKAATAPKAIDGNVGGDKAVTVPGPPPKVMAPPVISTGLASVGNTAVSLFNNIAGLSMLVPIALGIVGFLLLAVVLKATK
jgi:hypothetical protein